MPRFGRGVAQLPEHQQAAVAYLRLALQHVTGPALCACVLAVTLPILEDPQPPRLVSLTIVGLLCAGAAANATNSLMIGWWAATFSPGAALFSIWFARICIYAAYPLLAVWAWGGLFHLFMAGLVAVMSVFALIGLGRARTALRAVTLMT